MTFKGATQRWRKMNAKRVKAISGLFIGGAAPENKIEAVIIAEATEDNSDLTVTDGAQEKIELDVSDAALGDIVTASFNKDIEDLIVTGYVSEAGKVQVLVTNETGASVTISQPYTVKVAVVKI